MTKYLLKDGELYNLATGHKMKKHIIDRKAKNPKEYWGVVARGEQRYVQVCPGNEELYLDKYHVNYVKADEGSEK